MNKACLALATSILISPLTHADQLLGVYAGAYQWNQNYDGHVEDVDANDRIDVKDDLDLDDEDGNVIYVALEHGIPGLPNLRLQQTELEIDGEGEFSVSVDFGDGEFVADVDIISELDLSHTDATFYWQVLDNWVSLDLGITARWFDGEIQIEQPGSGERAEEDLEAVVPLFYAAARVDLPLSGLYAGFSGNFLGDGDNSFIDYQAVLGYETDYRFGIEAGYRSLELDLDDVDDIEADISVDGAFIGLFVHL